MSRIIHDAIVGDVASSADLAQLFYDYFGEQLDSLAGVLHTAAVWRAPDGSLSVLRIGDETPKSVVDGLMLNLGRARADAVVTTGKILRLEPGLSFEPFGPGALPAALRSWRYRRWQQPPTIVVLTSGRGLPWNHALFSQPVVVELASDARGVARMREQRPAVLVRQTRLLELAQSGITQLVAHLRARGDQVTIEAGPSTAVALYRPGEESAPLVDWLLLSTYVGDRLPDSVRGAEFLPPSEIERHFVAPTQAATSEDGSWSFRLWRRPLPGSVP